MLFARYGAIQRTRPKTLAGIVLYQLAKDSMHIHNDEEARAWILRLSQ